MARASQCVTPTAASGSLDMDMDMGASIMLLGDSAPAQPKIKPNDKILALTAVHLPTSATVLCQRVPRDPRRGALAARGAQVQWGPRCAHPKLARRLAADFGTPCSISSPTHFWTLRQGLIDVPLNLRMFGPAARAHIVAQPAGMVLLYAQARWARKAQVLPIVSRVRSRDILFIECHRITSPCPC